MTKLQKNISMTLAVTVLAVSAFTSTALASDRIYSSEQTVISDSVVGVYERADLKENTIEGSSGSAEIIDEGVTAIVGSVVGQYKDTKIGSNTIKGGKRSKGDKAIYSSDAFVIKDSVAGTISQYSEKYNYIGR